MSFFIRNFFLRNKLKKSFLWALLSDVEVENQPIVSFVLCASWAKRVKNQQFFLFLL
jgi:hypothetical protein